MLGHNSTLSDLTTILYALKTYPPELDYQAMGKCRPAMQLDARTGTNQYDMAGSAHGRQPIDQTDMCKNAMTRKPIDTTSHMHARSTCYWVCSSDLLIALIKMRLGN